MTFATYLAFADATVTTAPTGTATMTTGPAVTVAPGGAKAAAKTAPPQWYDMLKGPLPLILIAVFVMLAFGGKGKRADEKTRQAMLKALKRGDKVQTIGGVQGTVVTVEAERVSVKVDETKDTKMWFARTAIAQVLVDGDGKVVDAK